MFVCVCARAWVRWAHVWCYGWQGVQHWKKVYQDSNKYHKVGRVSHPPIDPASPIPEHCDPKKAQAAKEREQKAKGGESAGKGEGAAKHEEL